MIVATAGHVDHGKTALVRALTGVDTDRLEEEKRRGLSINLGYAYLPIDGETPLGFVDVPGHQRFVNTMICGASGIDMALLIVAADDGPMPQTLEHLDVLRVLGVASVAVVITKIDRVDAKRAQEVAEELAQLLSPSWEHTPFFYVNNLEGNGVDELRDHLIAAAKDQTLRQDQRHFYLSVDRSFTLKGTGLIVTGTAAAGSVSVGDTVRLEPSGKTARVRSVRAHDEQVEQAHQGQRCALNLVGNIEAAQIQRGESLVAMSSGPPSARIDVSVNLLLSAPFALKHLAPVKVYVGASRIPARIYLLAQTSLQSELAAEPLRRLAPGMQGFAQLLLDEDIASFCGQEFLLRDDSESFTLGGGKVLDPYAPRSKKSSQTRIEYLEAMTTSSAVSALTYLLARNHVVDLQKLSQAWHCPDDSIDLSTLEQARSFSGKNTSYVTSNQHWREAQKIITSEITQWHENNPLERGVRANQLEKSLRHTLSGALFKATLLALISQQKLALMDGLIKLTSHKAQLSQKSAQHLATIVSLLKKAGKQILLVSEISKETGLAVAEVEQIAMGAVKRGELFKLTERRYALPQQLLELSSALIALSQKQEPITARSAKQAWQLGRNLSIELLEYFDSVRFTRRQGDERIIIDPELPQRLYGGAT